MKGQKRWSTYGIYEEEANWGSHEYLISPENFIREQIITLGDLVGHQHTIYNVSQQTYPILEGDNEQDP